MTLVEREAALQAQIDGHDSELDQLYGLDPMREDTGQLQAQLAALRGEVEDVRRRLPGARAAEQRAQQAVTAEQRRVQEDDRQDRARRLLDAAAASDEAIDTAVGALQDALDRRWALGQERDQLDREAEAFGGRMQLPEVTFDVSRIPALRRERRGIRLQI
jgi:Skp family chaperone for outer membrane proteins